MNELVLSRRRLLSLGLAGLAGCARPREEATAPTPSVAPATFAPTAATSAAPPAQPGVLRAWPATEPPTGQPEPGTIELGLDAERDTLLYVPAGYTGAEPAPLVVLLHGAGGDARQGLSLLQAYADDAGLLLVAPASREQTWDVIAGGYGPDVERLDAALGRVFARFRVDPARLAVGGFSDGASYALSLGLMNGTLFSHIIAFSPGFMAPERQEGQPRVFIAHGTRDEVLPIDRCSRQIVPRLETAGYDVRYHEFDGPHTVPAPIASEAVAWFTAA